MRHYSRFNPILYLDLVMTHVFLLANCVNVDRFCIKSWFIAYLKHLMVAGRRSCTAALFKFTIVLLHYRKELSVMLCIATFWIEEIFKENVAYKADRVKFKGTKERTKIFYQGVTISIQIHVKQLYTVQWKTQKLRLSNKGHINQCIYIIKLFEDIKYRQSAIQ